jgi:hypothetical protein
MNENERGTLHNIKSAYKQGIREGIRIKTLAQLEEELRLGEGAQMLEKVRRCG